jgi:hypothetical protein
VLHASHPVSAIALARAGGVLKIGKPCGGLGVIGVST